MYYCSVCLVSKCLKVTATVHHCTVTLVIVFILIDDECQ